MNSKTKRTWRGLVNYANGGESDEKVRATVADCMGWVAAIEPFGLFDSMTDDNLAKQVVQYRPAVDLLLRFLCSDAKSKERNGLRSQAFAFLREHGQHIGSVDLKEVFYDEKSLKKFNYSRAELENFKEWSGKIWNKAQYNTHDFDRRTAGKDFLPLGIWAPSKSYQDLADPICDFLMSEYHKYLNREKSRRDKEPAPIVPVFVCPSCNKLVMPERVSRRYCFDCSDRARSEKYRRKAPADEDRDYQWLHRLRHKESALRRVFLRNQKNQGRLEEIKSRQKESSRCQCLLLEMRL